MNPNPFTKQGKGYRVRPVKWFTVDKWLEGSKPFQVVHQFNLSRKTVTNIVDQFVHTEIKGPTQSFVNGKDQVQYVYYGKAKTVHQN